MAGFKNPPIRRHASLVPLARDHYRGLAAAQDLGRAAAAGPAERRRAAERFLEAWRSPIADHLADEERVLVPRIGPADERRLAAEHASLRRFAREAAAARDGAPSGPWLRLLAAVLRDHIRWEDRALFRRIEADAGEAALERIGAETARIERERTRCAP